MKYRYEFSLANGEDRYLVTDMNYRELQQYIKSNDWIKLYHHGRVSEGSWVKFVPKIADIQTCNIVRMTEDEGYNDWISEAKLDKEKRLEIIKEIEKYELNRLNKFLFRRKIKFYHEDENLEHELLVFNEYYLLKLLEWVKRKSK